MMRVHDLDKSLKFYKDALELKTSHRLDFPDFSLVYLEEQENDVEIELTWNKGREAAYTHGDGYGHIAVAVPNLESEHARMTGLGHQSTPIKEFKRGDEMLARFFFLQDPDGYKIEVLERAGHYVISWLGARDEAVMSAREHAPTALRCNSARSTSPARFAELLLESPAEVAGRVESPAKRYLGDMLTVVGRV